jgi:hypothetical protein
VRWPFNLLNCREQVKPRGNLQKQGHFCFDGLTCSRLGEARKKWRQPTLRFRGAQRSPGE